jgi:predicted Zn finger-like uncharacterized protein
MSLKTRCPACDTIFKIVPDQLKVSKGWVRCGRCAEVFDAAAHAAAPDETNPWPQSTPPQALPKNTPTVSQNTPNTQNTPKNIAIEAINTTGTGHLAVINEKIESDLSFVRVAKSKAFWQQKSIITSLRAACVGLTGLLFFQLVFGQRHHLVATNPGLSAGFESMCQVIGCRIEPLKNIDAFKIDSSSFHKIPAAANNSSNADAFSLKISIKNNASMPLVVPAIELTLTDTSDKPVLRRVFPAKDLGFQGVTLAANGDWASETTLTVIPNPSTSPISGYRVLLFYP